MSRVVVVGSGLSGLFSAVKLRKLGHEVTLVTFGLGGLQLSQGTIDVLGYTPDGQRVERPFEALDALPEGHPYRVIGKDAVRAGVDELIELLGPDLLVGDPQTNDLYPTGVGAMRPTAVAQPSMVAGRCEPGATFLIVGFRQLKDFYPDLIAGNLNRTELPGGGHVNARAAMIDLPARAGEVDSTGTTYARALDLPELRETLVGLVRPLLQSAEAVGLPAVLGLNNLLVADDLSQRLGAKVFEISMQPPSMPGMRLNQTLTEIAKRERVRIVLGSAAVGLVTEGSTITGVQVDMAGGVRTIAADVVVHAPGGFESGALAMDSYGTITEKAFGLPLVGTDAPDLVHGDYWGKPQPLFKVGVAVDEAMRVLGPDGSPVYTNLHAAGSILAGAIRWEEKSGEGIALGSAWRAVHAIHEGA